MGSITLRYISGEGDEVVTSLAEADAGHVAHGRPVRGFGSHAGMKHYPGWWWSSTTTSLIPYESLLERDRLLVADFDRDVVAIASQPFGLSGRVRGSLRRHVPDFLLMGADGTPTVVDVKPNRLAARPVVAETLEWTAHLLHERGWRYEVWTGLDSTVRENLRFLAAGRRPDLADPEALAVLRGTDVRGRLIGMRCRTSPGQTGLTSDSSEEPRPRRCGARSGWWN